MESTSVARDHDFPPQLDDSEIANRCARESFTWGPQAWWWLTGLIWLFLFLIRDVPDVARKVLPFALGATVLAGLAVWYEMRKHKRRIALLPRGDRIGCYRANAFQYSFGREEMLLVRKDFFDRLMIVLKLLVPMVLLMVIIAVVIYDGIKQGRRQPGQDIAVFVYAMAYAIFGFIAIYRSNFRLLVFWIPNSEGETNQPLHLHPRELARLAERVGAVSIR